MSSTESFDYVIVGGGVAGLVLAARLTEDPATSVVVLEAGDDVTSKPDIQIPGLAFRNIGRPDLHWMFMSTPQTGANDRVIFQPRGKALGGSGTVNYLTVGRAHAQEYDAFEALGGKGWNWASILEYLKKSETFSVTPEETEKFGVKVNPKYHGTSGPFHRTLPKWSSDLYDPFVEALESLHIPYNTDSSSGDNLGVWASNHAIHPTDVVRSSSATGYYEPNKERPNLRVLTGAQATRVILRRGGEEGHTAEGIEFTKDGKSEQVLAKKEVILAAGAYQSPQLLELSGIGDKTILDQNKINVLVDLPGVGRNLQEHFWCSYTAEVDPSFQTVDVLFDEKRAAAEFEAYQKTKTGMMTHVASSVFAFVPSKGFMEDDSFQKVATAPLEGSDSDRTLKIQKEWLLDQAIPHMELALVPAFMPATGKSAEPGKRYMSFLVALQHAFSRGTVHISSSDSLAPPLIDPHVFDNEIDLEMMIQGLKFARKVVQTPAFKDIVKAEISPGIEVASDEDLRKLAKETVQTVYHPVGTAALLPREEGGVVDSDLKVYGTKNLRVIDASVIPIHISAHPQTTVYAIAERAADIIKNAI